MIHSFHQCVCVCVLAHLGSAFPGSAQQLQVPAGISRLHLLLQATGGQQQGLQQQLGVSPNYGLVDLANGLQL